MAVAIKCVQEQIVGDDILRNLNWETLEKCFNESLIKERNMVILTNLTYFEKFFSSSFKGYLLKCIINRVKNESKMNFL